ncbi:MAG: hypothetical protein LUH05_06090 [Candidatus Gastranaerophilales bacterium]|nr:hypothetical protein [Candidatus Gastranaerophilales bacterium]
MKKFLKPFHIIICNLAAIAFVFFVVEIILWICENYRMKKNNEVISGSLWPLSFHPGIKFFNLDCDNFPNPDNNYGRLPMGLNYTKPAIVLFGCSFAYGFKLKEEQTFPYKIANLSKRPVYVRAVPGWGIQHMLYQVQQDEFYNIVPEPEYAVYIMMCDHFRRLYVPTFNSMELLNEDFNLTYHLDDNKLIRNKTSNPIILFIKRLYLVQKITHFYINNVILKERNYDKYSAFAIEHFIESKQAMEKHWKNTKYVVLLYDYLYNEEKFKKSLEKNGFIVINVSELVNQNMYSPEYRLKDYHPNEKAWNLITPAVVKELNL